MSLFQIGDFVLSSGDKSSFKIDCDALTQADLRALALMISKLVGSFSSVEGVPGGGLLLAEALRLHQAADLNNPHLIVDDVLTTGSSLERAKVFRFGFGRHEGKVIGAVVFARGRCPWWVKSLFQMPEALWVKQEVGK